MLSYVGNNKTFSQGTVKALRTIKYCALVTAGAIVTSDAFLVVVASGNDDPAGAVMLGIIATFASIVIATAAAVLERVLQSAVEIKSENDLTI